MKNNTVRSIHFAHIICFPALALNLLKGFFERSGILFLIQLFNPTFTALQLSALTNNFHLRPPKPWRRRIRFTRVPDRNDSEDWVKTSAGRRFQSGNCNVIRYSFVMLVLFTSNISFGYFYHLCVWKTIDKQTGKVQFIIGLADFHDKTHPANKTQRVYIDSSLLKKCVAVKGKLIVEDLSSVNNDGRMHCCNFGINSCEGVLGQLANKARSVGVVVDNVEYRYCRVAGIGPLLSNIESNPHSFKSTAAITAVTLHKEVVDEIEKIKKYDDGKVLNAQYRRTVSVVGDALSKIGFNVAQQKPTIAHYCSKLPRKQYRQELEKLCIFDSALIDMKIMHSIVASPEAPVIFVVAGGSHIEQMSAMLKNIGYELIFITSQTASSTIKKVANVNADVLPEPVDITIIDRFIE